MLDDLGAGYSVRSAAQQELEQRELFRRERNRPAGAGYTTPVTIQFDVGIPKHAATAAERPSHERAHAPTQFYDSKRLCQVVIGACIESLAPLLDESASRQHQNWGIDSCAPEL